MKKLFALLMTLVLVFSVSDVALADQAKMTVSGKESVKRGEKVEYTVSLADCEKANTLGIEVSYDDDVWAKVTNDCGWSKEGKLQDFDPVKNIGVWAVDTAQTLDGDVFKLSFTVNGNAPFGETEVAVKLIVKYNEEVIGTFTDTIKVNVVCEHAYGDWTNKDANNHVKVCKNCKHEVTEAHKWDAGKVTTAATATKAGTKTYTCTVCKATKTESIPATGEQGGTTPPAGDSGNQGSTTTPDTNKPDSSKPGTTTPPSGDSGNQGGTTTPDTEDVPAVEIKDTVVKEKVDEIQKAEEGKDVVIEMKQENGKVATVVPVEILDAVKGKDVDVVLNMGEYSWTINGKDVKDGAKDINLEVVLDTKAVDETVVKELAGNDTARQISLSHDGEFNFKATLTINVGKDFVGKFGNLYYHEGEGKLTFVSAAKVDENGNVNLDFSHASDYVVVLGEDRSDDENTNQGTTTPDDENNSQKPGDDKPVDDGKDDGGINAGAIFTVILIIGAIAGAAYYFIKKK